MTPSELVSWLNGLTSQTVSFLVLHDVTVGNAMQDMLRCFCCSLVAVHVGKHLLRDI